MGVGVRFCWRYQAKILWPNFCGFEEAPATAMRGEDMKVRAAVCMVGGGFGVVVLLLVVLVLLSVVVVVVDFESRFCDLVVAGISGWWVCVGLISFRKLMGGLITCIIVL
jgi:hypothetical protein